MNRTSPFSKLRKFPKGHKFAERVSCLLHQCSLSSWTVPFCLSVCLSSWLDCRLREKGDSVLGSGVAEGL